MGESLSWEERVESLKAGLIAGSLAAIAEASFQTFQVFVWPKAGLPDLPSFLMLPAFWEDLTIAGFSGFLFGVTCRYAIRQDQNPHLSSGVVLAFGLVRGLAQIRLEEVGVQDASLVLFAIVESVALFAIAYLGLSISLERGWVRYCP